MKRASVLVCLFTASLALLLGFMPGTSLDKDGILTGALFAECAAEQLAAGHTMEEYLQHLYQRFFYFLLETLAQTRTLGTDVTSAHRLTSSTRNRQRRNASSMLFATAKAEQQTN